MSERLSNHNGTAEGDTQELDIDAEFAEITKDLKDLDGEDPTGIIRPFGAYILERSSSLLRPLEDKTSQTTEMITTMTLGKCISTGGHYLVDSVPDDTK